MANDVEVSDSPEMQEGGTTGRYLVVFNEGTSPETVRQMTESAGMRIAHSADFRTAALETDAVLSEADGMFFDELNVAVCQTPPAQVNFLSATSNRSSAIMAVEPERYVFTMEQLERMRISEPLAPIVEGSREYLRGFRDATAFLYDRFARDTGQPVIGDEPEAGTAAVRWSDTSALTWGLQATRASRSTFTGRGIRVAVLDTGFDFGHPDFINRVIQQASFVTGETAHDGHGHGTHCAGTAAGPARPGGTSRRYGVASDAELFVGKVLGNGGSGSDGGILAGIDWAIRNGCRIVSMSLGAPTRPNDRHSQVYEIAARRALDRNTLIVAAAGNESSRPGRINPVAHPANCPSILAVGAIDSSTAVGWFSNRGTSQNGGRIDVAAPGVAVFSSWTRPRRYNSINGTSMATPHVAGIAALYLQADPTLNARQLWLELQRRALRIAPASIDVGAGLVQSV